ncbi:MAG: EAL domain-containing protein [Gammaproteobacteria bacterium]|nr:EAL domain-containing protein [Gammaproteobacteria bacterium]MDH5803516.1 EAL domain-containing protein [Gammaproteobacteria bacterium]
MNLKTNREQSHSPQILVVDDERDARLLIRKELEAAGFGVYESPDGVSALTDITRYQPDLVLLDVKMPGMDGISVCQSIRAMEAFKKIPILMLTGVDGLEYIRRAFDAGATDFINKTTNLGFVSQRIRYVLRNIEQQDALFTNQRQLEEAQRVAKLGYWKFSVDISNFSLSEQARKILCISPTGFDNTLNGYLNLIHISDRDMMKSAIECALYEKESFSIDYRIIDVTGKKIYIHSQGEVVEGVDGSVIAILATVQDISERKKSEATFEHMALYDGLTDLCNRSLFQNRLAHSMAMAHREEKLLALCFLDLDNFKQVNDTLGHAVGDELLKSVAKRLKSSMRQGDVIARLGGDEFGIVVEGLSTIDELEKIVTKLRNRLGKMHHIRGHDLLVSASIGVTLYPLDSADKNTILANADAAMYKAKELGGNRFCFYSHDMDDRSHRRLDMEQKLRNALKNNELRVYYQPRMQLDSGDIVAVEALLRWQHPDFGLLPPSKFIKIAEETGLIYPIGLWLLKSACTQILKWKRLGLGDLHLAINMSGRQFAQQDMIRHMQKIMLEIGFNPQHLIIEITENVAMRNITSVTETLSQIKAMGAVVAIDDFGAGHSSMNHLQRLPIDMLNIDRSFIMNVAGRERDGATARAIIALAHGLGLKVIAEGVETQTQVDFLRKYKCDAMQGHFISPPVPAAEVVPLLESRELTV